MKKLIFLLMFSLFLGFSQAQNVVSADRIFPKAGKGMELEKAIAAHAQKYHTGNWKWRVFDIQTGPDAGGYHIVEGPNSWTTLDSRGEISKEHTNDWDKTVAPLLSEKGSSLMAVYNEELSTVQLTDYAPTIILNHIYLKPGMVDRFKDEMKKSKAAWTAGNESIAIYETAASGPPQITVSVRLKNGLKEMEKGYRKPFKERYIAANGEGSYDAYLKMYNECVDSRWSEILKQRPDLGSK